MFFEKSGSKIRKSVNIVFLIILILHGIAALALFIVACGAGDIGTFIAVFFLGCIALLINTGAAYLYMLEFAAFGEMVENTQSIRDAIEQRKYVQVVTKNRSMVAETSGGKPGGYSDVRAERKQGSPAIVLDMPDSAKVVYCTQCGKSQHAGNKKCFSCGAELQQPGK